MHCSCIHLVNLECCAFAVLEGFGSRAFRAWRAILGLVVHTARAIYVHARSLIAMSVLLLGRSRLPLCIILPSSCRLSMSACFCASVIPNTLRFSGLLSGVCVSSSPVFVGTTAVVLSLDDTDALADAICFCFRGGMVCCVLCRCFYYVKYVGGVSRRIIQPSGENMLSQL